MIVIRNLQDHLSKVAANIRRHLKSNDFKFKEVAQKSMIAEKRFYALMDGRARFEILEYAAVCEALEVNMEFFLEINS